MPSTLTQIRYARTVRPSSNRLWLTLIVISLLLLFGCAKEDLMILNLRATLANENNIELVYITFSLSERLDREIQVQIDSPDEKSRWMVTLHADGSGTYAFEPLAMGREIPLTKGEYRLVVMSDDGRRVEEHFFLYVR